MKKFVSIILILTMAAVCISGFAEAASAEMWEETTDTKGEKCLIFSTQGSLGKGTVKDGSFEEGLNFDVIVKPDKVEISLNAETQPSIKDTVSKSLGVWVATVFTGKAGSQRSAESAVGKYEAESRHIVFESSYANVIKRAFEKDDVIIQLEDYNENGGTGVFCLLEVAGPESHFVFDIKYEKAFGEDVNTSAIKGSIGANQISYIGQCVNGRFRAVKNGKMGIIDAKGNVIQDFNYDVIQYMTEDAFCVYKGTTVLSDAVPCVKYVDSYKYAGKFGIYDYNGNEISAIQWDAIESLGNGLWMVAKDGKLGAINAEGKQIAPCKYTSVKAGEDGIGIICEEVEDPSDRYRSPVKATDVYDLLGNKRFTYSGKIYGRLENGLGRVQVGEKYGYLDMTGNMAISPEYDDAGSFSNGRAVVEKSGKYWIIDTTGAKIADIPGSVSFYSTPIEDGAIFVSDDSIMKMAVFDADGNKLTGFDFVNYYGFDHGFATVQNSAGQWKVINSEGKDVLPYGDVIRRYISDGYFRTEKDSSGSRKYGIIDAKGGTILECVYDDISYGDGYYVVQKGTSYNIYDSALKKVF